jgi:carboxyl-terminal processing protease
MRLLSALFLIVLSLSFAVPAYAQEDAKKESQADAASPQEKLEDTYKQLNLFGDVFERARSQYVDPVTDKELIEHAVRGMLSNLDPHSDYLDEKDFGEMRVQTKGEFGGLGIEVTMEEGLVKVVSPIDGTPAFKAGVKAGDLITHLDKKPIMGMKLNEAVDKMRGKVGTKIELTIRREGISEPIFLNIVRDIIRIEPVRSHVEGGNVGYVRVTTFNQNTAEGLLKAMEKIKKEAGNKLVGYVLDLRNNPGGLLDQAIAVSDTFLERGEIVSTRGRSETDIKRDNATAGDMAGGLPIVVLINGGSASASEIVAGALQDHHRAIVMGTKSFGKGSVQTIIPLPGYGAMRLTTARYFTPSGRSIQAKGIEPDIVVEQAKVEQLDEMRIHEADLKGALENPDGEAPPPAKEAPEEKPEQDKKGDKKSETPKNGNEDGQAAEDYQLTRAIDLLYGLDLYRKQQD